MADSSTPTTEQSQPPEPQLSPETALSDHHSPRSRSTTPIPKDRSNPSPHPPPHPHHLPPNQSHNNWPPQQLMPYPAGMLLNPANNGSGRNSPWLAGPNGGPQGPQGQGMMMNGASSLLMPNGPNGQQPFPGTGMGAKQSIFASSPSPLPLPPNDTRTQIFIANLPFRVRWQDLKDLMRKVGTVLRADVALSQPDGRSRGFGVVLFARAEDAYAAIERYNGYVWQTRTLDVRLDTQDPTGVYAIAEANRQAAMQQQVQSFHHLSSLSQQIPVPIPMPMPIPIPMMQQNRTPSGLGGYRSVSPLPGQQMGMGVSPNMGMGVEMGLAPAVGMGQPPVTVGSVGSSSGTGTVAGGSPSLSQSLDKASPILKQQEESPSIDAVKEKQIEAEKKEIAKEISSPQPHLDATSSPSGRPSEHHSPHPQSYPQRVDMYPSQQQGPYPFNNGMGMGMGPPPPQFSQQQQQQYGPGPGQNGGMANFYQNQRAGMQSNNPVPQAYANRHLFVGNLPFNCQWQELKDLMRTAGAVLRADIAQGTDGRSRGFGSVLFTSPQDAERACQMFNGYDYNGRALKVHFDKFAHAPSGNSNGGEGPSPLFAAQTLPNGAQGHKPPNYGHPYSGSSSNGGSHHQSYERRPSAMASERYHPSDERYSKNSSAGNGSNTTEKDGEGGKGDGSTPYGSPGDRNDGKSHASPPGRISMPPPFPFAGPLSPLQGRNLPPMTPSMPAFTLGAFPQTPPLYPQFFSPGLGPFSPTMGSPLFGPGHQHHFNMNAAPGAPVHREGFNSFQSSFGNNVAPTPSAYQDVPYSSPPGSETIPQEPSYFPPVVASSSDSPSITSSHSEASTPATVHNSPDPSAAPGAPIGRPELPGQSKSDSVAAHLAGLKLSDGDALAPGWGGLNVSGAGGEEKARRRSFVTTATDDKASADSIRRRFEGDGAQERRASFDDQKRPRPKAFGQSIWQA